MEEIHNKLINHDFRLEEQQTTKHLNLPQLNLSQSPSPKQTQRPYTQSNFKPSNPFSFSNKCKPHHTNFTKSPNFQSSPFPNNRPGILGKPNFSQNTNYWTTPNNRQASLKQQCQICGKVGHTALVCYHRTNLQYQPQNSQFSTGSNTTRRNAHLRPSTFTVMLGTSSYPFASSSSESPWFLDSGATHHFTLDYGALDSSMPFVGDDQDLHSKKILLQGHLEDGLYKLLSTSAPAKSPSSLPCPSSSPTS